MIDDLRAMAIFAKTVEAGSFRAAAGLLGLSPSVVSHHVSQLEARLGAALLYRSTRQLSLTHDGRRLYESAKALLLAAEQGLQEIAARSADPAGKLCITVPAVLAGSTLTDDLAAFAQAHPRLALDLSFSDHKHDLIQDGIDVAIRIGALKDSALKAKKLFEFGRSLVAAPSVMAARAVPARPEELRDWPWIGLRMRPNFKVLSNGAGEACRVDFSPRIVVDSVAAVYRLALAGLGLATPPDFLMDEALRAGRLVEVLPGWRVESLGVYAVWPSNVPQDSLTLRFIRFLEARKQDRQSLLAGAGS